jgi:leucine-rich repeat protein SHOC2
VIRLDLTRDRLHALDARIVRFSALRELVLDRNKLTGLPPELRWVQTLERISISGNRLQSFPRVLLQIEGLREIDLSDNEIGGIPMDIDQIKSLEQLHLWGNVLARFPATLSDIPGLVKLDLLHNEMTAVEQEFLKTLLPNVSIEFSDPCQCDFDDHFELDNGRGNGKD